MSSNDWEARKDRMVASGTCIECGKAPARPNRLACKGCLDAKAARQKAARLMHGLGLVKAAYRCGDCREPGHNVQRCPGLKRAPAVTNHVVTRHRGELSITLPLKLESPNKREHWTQRSRRTDKQRGIAKMVVYAERNRQTPELRLPVDVVVTRVGRRDLDAHDNLPMSAKPLVDGIADAFGIQDNDERISWSYAQERGGYAVRITIRARAKSVPLCHDGPMTAGEE